MNGTSSTTLEWLGFISEKPPEPGSSVIDKLRWRARDLRRRGRAFTVCAVATAVGAAVLLFVSGTVFLERGSLERSAVLTKQRQLDDKFSEVIGAMKTVVSDGKILHEFVDEARDVDKSIDLTKRATGATDALIDVTVAVHDLGAKIDALDEFVERRLPDVIAIPVEESHNLLLTTVVIRAGVAVLAVLLFSFFASSYRYSTKLSYFYDARADVLERFAGATYQPTGEIVALMSALTPQLQRGRVAVIGTV